MVFENRKIRNYKVTDFFSIQKLAIQNLSSFFQDPRWFMLPQGYRMINTKKSISNSNLFQTLKVKRNMFQVITTKTFMDQLDNFKLRNFAKILVPKPGWQYISIATILWIWSVKFWPCLLSICLHAQT